MKNIRQYKILVVDDIKTNLDVLIQTLGDDYILAIAMNGQKAIKYVEKNHPDLILLDIMMPEMDGFEVCRRLKANLAFRDIPIIFITSVNSASEKINVDNQLRFRYQVGYWFRLIDASIWGAKTYAILNSQLSIHPFGKKTSYFLTGSQSPIQRSYTGTHVQFEAIITDSGGKSGTRT